MHIPLKIITVQCVKYCTVVVTALLVKNQTWSWASSLMFSPMHYSLDWVFFLSPLNFICCSRLSVALIKVLWLSINKMA